MVLVWLSHLQFDKRIRSGSVCMLECDEDFFLPVFSNSSQPLPSSLLASFPPSRSNCLLKSNFSVNAAFSFAGSFCRYSSYLHRHVFDYGVSLFGGGNFLQRLLRRGLQRLCKVRAQTRKNNRQ